MTKSEVVPKKKIRAVRANFFFGIPEVELRMCRYGFGSGLRGVATPDYDLNFDPEAC